MHAFPERREFNNFWRTIDVCAGALRKKQAMAISATDTFPKINPSAATCVSR
jgi:hypothetical protein